MASFPTCVVCNTSFKYKGPKPHLLPCLHAVCSGCLGTHGNSTITCSVCQRSHDRINQSFPVDHVVLADVLHLTAQHRPSEISCTNKEDGNQAVCWCEECSEFLCEHCQISHTEVKVTRVHKLWEMSVLSKTFQRSHAKCIRHGLPENVFDTDCGHFICYQCLFTDHTNHAAITLEESSSLDNNNLKEGVKSVSEKKNEVLQSYTAVDAHTSVLEVTSFCLRENVKHTFSELRSLLDQREKVILLELDQLMECMNTTNNSRRPVLKGIETACQTTLDYINKCLLYTPPEQFHQLKSSVLDATQFCNSSDVPLVHTHEASVTLSKQGLQDLKTAISSFAGFLAPVGETVQSDEFTSSQLVKIKHLETTIEGLRRQTTVTSQEMKTLTEEVSKRGDQIQELEETNRHLQKVVQQIEPDGLAKGSFLHLIKSDCNRVFVVKCPKMSFDEHKANLHQVRIDSDVLIYDYNATRDNAGHLQKHCGTSATSALPSSGLVYWEVEADVNLVDRLDNDDLVLEIAVCDEDVMDVSFYVGAQSSSCSLSMAYDKTDASICLYIFENGFVIEKKRNFLPNVAVGVPQLKFGILFDGKTKKVTFIDVADMKVLGQGTVSLKSKPAKLWPMFALQHVTKKMKLVSGVNIKMSIGKTIVLSNVLSAAIRS